MSTVASVAPADVAATRERAVSALLDQRAPGGHWDGELSSSALSTATAVAALALAARAGAREAADARALVDGGLAWLAANANADGGYGDTVESPTNLSTTTLAWMAFTAARRPDAPAARGARAWLESRLGDLTAARLGAALAEVYGADRTFAVPILASCAAAGCFGAEWPRLPGLPFELAALPRATFRHVGLPVVSYALPALIAIGQALHARTPSPNPLVRWLRDRTRARTLRTLGEIQPAGGGFLEATPLTSFVVLSLVAADRADDDVVARGLEFLRASARADGSWPIDTNLRTWGTTLAIGALAAGGRGRTYLDPDARAGLRAFLLAQQHRERHPYTGAAPGGWAWTDLPGGVPDADDTAGALLALRVLGDDGAPDAADVHAAAAAGARWLVDLANRDGGVPTFCRGWGRLPFDRSAADLTAHALRAWAAWPAEDELAGPGWTGRRVAAARRAAAAHGARTFLVDAQRADGAWVPLWFGNQHEPTCESPLYGTARVLLAAGAAAPREPAADAGRWRAALARGLGWLTAAQGADGGFGGAPGCHASIEETALGLEALAGAVQAGLAPRAELAPALDAAEAWLVEHTGGGSRFPASPIGLYFARLWYSERLYPLVFTVAALERAEAARAAR